MGRDTQNREKILRQLCECEPGKGMMLPLDLHRAADGLIAEGWAYSIDGGFGAVYIATDEGRKENEKTTGQDADGGHGDR